MVNRDLQPVVQEVIKTTPKMRMADRLQHISKQAAEILACAGVGDVAAEQYNIGPKKRNRTAQTFYLHGLVGVRLLEHGLRAPLMIAPPTHKKWITGTGKAEKDEIRQDLEEWLGCTLHKDHNVVDAVGLAVMLMQRHLWMAGKWTPNKYELEKMRNWQRMM